MNKLKTQFNAAVAPDWDDFDWLQESARDALYGFLSAFGIDPVDSFILSGCQFTIVTNVSITTTAGYLSLNGEILKVDPHTIPYTEAGGSIVWRLQETNDPSGTEADSNGNTVECYQKRRAVLVQPGSAGEMPYNAPTLITKIKQLTDLDDLETVVNGFTGAWISWPFDQYDYTGPNLLMSSLNTKLYTQVIGKTMLVQIIAAITSMDTGILKIDLKGATGYDIKKTMYSAMTLVMSGNNLPVLAQGIAEITDQNKILLTIYTGNLPTLSNAFIFGQIMLEVDKT